MSQTDTQPQDNLDFHVNLDQSGTELVVVHNTADDEGGFDGAIEGGQYVMPGILAVLEDSRLKITELGVLSMNLSKEPPPDNDDRARHLRPIARHASIAIEQVYRAFLEGKKVLSLGGNHVRGLDVMGAMRACHEMGIPFGLVWVDAHPDLNTPESTYSGHIHGMVSSVLQGRGPKELLNLLNGAPFIDPNNIIYVGINAIDDQKNADGTPKDQTELKYLRALREKNIQCCFTMESMKDARGKGRVPEEVKQAVTELSDRLKVKGGKLWVEWDVDAVGVQDMPAAVMDNLNGMSAAQIHDLFNHLGSRCSVDGVGVSELAPHKDIDGKSANLVAEGVGNLLGVSNAAYAMHMARARNELEGRQHPASAEHVVQPAPQPSRKKRPIRKRVLDFVAGSAAAIGAIIAGHKMTKQTPIPAPVSMLALDSLHQLSQSDFLATAGQLRLMVEKGDQQGTEVALNKLAAIYEAIRNRAPGAAAISDLGQLSLSEFVRGYTGGTHAGSPECDQYFQKFLRRVS